MLNNDWPIEFNFFWPGACLMLSLPLWKIVFNVENTSINIMVLVYTHHIGPRVRYAFDMLFHQFLSCEVRFTAQVEEFIAYDGVKISYTKNPLGSELFFRSHPIYLRKVLLIRRFKLSHGKVKRFFLNKLKIQLCLLMFLLLGFIYWVVMKNIFLT